MILYNWNAASLTTASHSFYSQLTFFWSFVLYSTLPPLQSFSARATIIKLPGGLWSHFSFLENYLEATLISYLLYYVAEEACRNKTI